jgi:hypothetical protein
MVSFAELKAALMNNHKCNCKQFVTESIKEVSGFPFPLSNIEGLKAFLSTLKDSKKFQHEMVCYLCIF